MGAEETPESDQKRSAALKCTVSRRYLRRSRDIFGRVREGQEGRYGAERALSSARRGEEAVGPPLPKVGLTANASVPTARARM